MEGAVAFPVNRNCGASHTFSRVFFPLLDSLPAFFFRQPLAFGTICKPVRYGRTAAACTTYPVHLSSHRSETTKLAHQVNN